MVRTIWQQWCRKAAGLTSGRRRKRSTNTQTAELLEVRVVPTVDLTISTAASANFAASTAAGTTTFTATGTGAMNLNVSDIQAALAAGNDVVIDNTNALGSGTGAITWDAAADLDVNGIAGTKSLTINQDVNATGDVTIDAQIIDSNVTTHEQINLTVNATNNATLADTISAAATIDVTAQGAVHLNGDITATASLNVASGTDGTGDVSFGTGVQVNANVQAYTAGDGTGGAATTAKVDLLTNGPILSDSTGLAVPTSVSIEQDANITVSTLPALVQFSQNVLPATFTLTSDDGVIIDLVAPDTTITPTSAFGATSEAHFIVGGVDNVTVASGLTYKYSVDGGAYVNLATGTNLDLTGLTDGDHTISVVAVDAAGNIDATPATFSYTADVTTPTIVVPSTQSVTANLKLVFSGSAAITINDVDAGSGTQTVQLTVGTGLLTLGSTAGISFIAGDGTADATMTIRGSRAAINAALSTLSYTSATVGGDTLNIVVTDNGGLTSSNSLGINVLAVAGVDVTPPDTSFVTTAPVGNTGTARFTFTGTDNVSTSGALHYQYSLDGSTFLDINAANGGLIDVNVATDGEHTIQIRAIDEAGNIDATPVSYTWTANITAPTITVPPLQVVATNSSLTLAGAAAIVINDNDAGSATQTVTLSVLNGTLSLASTAGLSFTTGDGSGDATVTFTGLRAAVNAALNGLVYTPIANFTGSEVVHVTVADNGGLTSSGQFGIFIGTLGNDTVAPNTSFVVTSPFGNTGNAHFTFTGTDNLTAAEALRYQYSIDGSDFLFVNFSNGGLLDLAGLVDGEHTLQVRAIDENGNIDATPASFTWTANVTAPTIAFATTAVQNVQSGASLFFDVGSSNAITIVDNDSGSATQTVTLSVAHGTLTLGSLTGLSFTTGDGTSDSTITFTGLRAAVNAALSGLKYVSALNFSGSDTLMVSVTDNGGLSSSGSLGINVLGNVG